MRVTIISETVQEFDGTRYYRCGRYFQRRGVRLHRVVWEFHNGEIPDGFHVHHVDNDTANNQSENLECIPAVSHLAGRHGEESGIRGRRSIKRANTVASAWHGSAAGKQWHSEHFDKHIRPVMEARIPAVCEECGKEYLVSAAKQKQGRFCHPNCRARALRKRRRSQRGD